MLKEKISKDLILAMKNKDSAAKSVLTILKSNIQNEEIKLKRELVFDDEVTILNRERKQIKDSIEGFSNANRQDLVEQEKKKLAIVEQYLPKQLTVEEITQLIQNKIELGENNSGKIIGILSKEHKGHIDNKILADTVKQILN